MDSLHAMISTRRRGGRRLPLAAPALIAVFLLAAAAPAGAAPIEGEEGALAEGLEALRAGEYDRAIERFGEAAREGELAVELLRSWSGAFAATGRYEEAVETLRKDPKFEERPALLAAAGRIHLRAGRLEDARKRLEKAAELDPRSPEAHYYLGEALRQAGRLDEARGAYDRAIDAYRELDPADAGDLPAETYVHWGLALIALNRYREAEDIMFSQAEEREEKNPALLLERGRMFLDKYNFPDSREFLREAIDRNPNFADALAALAENYLTDFQVGTARFDQAEKFLERALKVNPRHSEAYATRGALWFYDGRLDRAAEDFRRAIAENPASQRARGLLAAALLIQGDDEGFEKAEAEALAVNPRAAEFFHTIALSIEQKFRYYDCVRMCDRALELDPGYWPAYVTLGINCLRTGEIERGREFLEKSWEKDRFNVWVYNTRLLLKHMDESFGSFENDRFVITMPREDIPFMRPYIEPLLDRAHKSLSERYKAEIPRPVRIECFSEHKWFSARTVGLEGFSASGACFGRLVTLTTPKALPQNWGAVAWHEFAHVVTLQLTDHRVPRWLTEGVSVYEEGRDNPAWARNFQREIADAWASGRLLPLAELDYGFSKPKFPMQILISYFQGCLIVDYIAGKWGFDAVLKILDGYRAHRGTEAIFRDVLGEGLAEFDRGFDAFVKAWVEKNGYPPRLLEEMVPRLELKRSQDPENVPVLCDLAWAYLSNDNLVDAVITAARALELNADSGDARAILGMARAREKKTAAAREELEKALELGTRFAFPARELLGDLLARRDDSRRQAIEHYEAAKKVSPIAGAGFPPGANIYYKLAKLYEQEKENDKAIAQMEELARFAVEDPQCRFRIVQYALERKDHERAARYLDELMFINPFEMPFHRYRAQAAEALGDHDTVIREMTLLLQDRQTNTLLAHLALARAHLGKGDRERAAEEARRVLKVDPEHAEAKEILEKAEEKP